MVHDANGQTNGDITIFVNGVAVKVNDATVIGSEPSGTNNVYFGESDYSGHDDFDGQIDEVRMVNYEKRAFAGGLMISKIDPSTNSVTIYNNNPSTTSGADNDMSLAGIEIYKDGGTNPVCSFSGLGGIEYQATKTINNCSLNDDDGIYMSDANPSNSQVYAADGYEFIIDAVCWNDDGSTIDDICESGEEMVKAGVWGAGSAIDGSGSSFIYQLATSGNNDEAVNDWEAIPEFGTLLMPIASVILIVGYNYRNKKTEK